MTNTLRKDHFIGLDTECRTISRLASTLGVSIAISYGFTTVNAQTPADPNPAMNNPDKFAWDLFIEINRPSLAAKRGIPDPMKKIGDPGLRVWETWKITTPIGSKVFIDRGQKPAPWDQPQAEGTGDKVIKFLSPRKFTFTNLELRNVDPHGVLSTTSNPRLYFSQESRINRAGVEFIGELTMGRVTSDK